MSNAITPMFEGAPTTPDEVREWKVTAIMAWMGEMHGVSLDDEDTVSAIKDKATELLCLL